MGGMTTLEYALNTPPGFVKSVIPLATSARHSAWCISWGEAQRQSIYSDPDYRDGYYYETPTGEVQLNQQPSRGLAAARMAALLTYRSRDSFESRFGRKVGGGKKSKVPVGGVRVMGGPETSDPREPSEADLAKSPRDDAWFAHNDGHRSSNAGGASRRGSGNGSRTGTATPERDGGEGGSSPVVERPLTNLSLGTPGTGLGTGGERHQKVFSAQSYLRYQGDKVGRVSEWRGLC
jgi:homoserine O-acetyltransferase